VEEVEVEVGFIKIRVLNGGKAKVGRGFGRELGRELDGNVF
jgi:hypothetical protein